MKSIHGRLSKLEDRLGITCCAPRYLLMLMDAGREFGPADDAYIKTLDEASLLPTGGFRVIDLSRIPERGVVKDTRIAPVPEITVEFV